MMRIVHGDLPGLLVLEPRVFGDSRGFFFESYNQNTLRQWGIVLPFVQDNHSGSRKGVLRGLHYQVGHAQGKLIRVVAGEVFDVAVDLRTKSPAFGRWFGMILSAAERKQIYIPPGFAHGFLTVSDWAEVLYKTTDFYAPECERCIIWNDPDIGIDWPLECPPTLSSKDSEGLPLSKADRYEDLF
ncbi:dTDP-4-dehydrorhamnose 3,5-epimerase [Syntrophobacter fumaroxidans MPOB]|uniref:dTDP-4-dehydrorhamnose 3,5-epimerase n=2 Tax=Syntrophobacter TaxID=29526 RepID=A0LKJ5_SYNFM|nr:dTDP-4-dehydrorhamnose 3,5-epimerase [Syntrophobacter fumaroxidans]ABK17947.1 dTDP-4-dehydrorhamnose 3,5-epimerase [Syntrophobacter fumaroxidans MPOB]